VQVAAYGRQTVIGVVTSCDPLKNFWGSNHISGMAEPKVVKFCIQVGYINSSNIKTYHPQKGRGYGHVTVFISTPQAWSPHYSDQSYATGHMSFITKYKCEKLSVCNNV